MLEAVKKYNTSAIDSANQIEFSLLFQPPKRNSVTEFDQPERLYIYGDSHMGHYAIHLSPRAGLGKNDGR